MSETAGRLPGNVFRYTLLLMTRDDPALRIVDAQYDTKNERCLESVSIVVYGGTCCPGTNTADPLTRRRYALMFVGYDTLTKRPITQISYTEM